jgi:hypothetical protein
LWSRTTKQVGLFLNGLRRWLCSPSCATAYRFSKKHPRFLDAATLSTPYLAEIEEH